jgi:type I restriction enzyme S subunit
LFTFVTSGSRGWAKHYTAEGPLFLRVGNLDHAGIALDLREVQHVAVPSSPEADRTRVRANDVLVSVTADVGMVAVVPETLGEAYINQHIALARPIKDLCVPYLAWYLASEHGGQRQFRSLQRGATKQGLGLDDIRSVNVPLAPLAEQRRIVAKIEELLSDLDAGVAALGRIRANLKRYRAAVLKAAVEGRLTEEWRATHPKTEPATKLLERILEQRRQHWEEDQLAKFAAADKTLPKNWREKYVAPEPPNPTELPALPKGWCWATLEAIAALVGGITKDQKRSREEGMKEVPYLRVANVQRGYLDLEEMKTIHASPEDISNLLLRRGDILFTEGGDRDKLGRGWIWQEELPECIHQNHIFRARLIDSTIQPKFVSHHGNTFGRDWFTAAGKQTTNLASINLGILRQFPVPIPPAEEQTQIVAELDHQLSIGGTEE